MAQRTREIGLPMALGARPSPVLAAVVSQGLGQAGAAVAFEVVGSLATVRLIEGMLCGVTPTDPAPLATAAAALTVVALGATYMPGRRATHVDPAVRLRAD